MLQVGEVSRRLGLNPQTLYFYERIGLMPSPQRTAAGYRLYSEADVERLSFITQAKTLGLSLDDIHELLALQDGQQLSCGEVYGRLLKKMQQIDDTIAKLQTLRSQLTPLLDQCQRGLEQSPPGQQCVVFQQTPLTAATDSLTSPSTITTRARTMTTLRIEILGTGCKKCQQLEANAKVAIATRDREADVAHITDPMEIVKRGVMKTPALVVDGKVLSQGKVLEPSDIEALLPA